MNSIWNKNLTLFEKRFPSLCEFYELNDSDKEELPERLKAGFEVMPSKSGMLTAKENGKLLHSGYNPGREAESAITEAKKAGNITTACFFSIALGYSALCYAQKYPEDTLIIIEPDARYFFTAMSFVDFSPLFAAKNIFIALQTGTDIVVSLVEKAGGFSHAAIIENQNQSAHAKDYFEALRQSIARAKSKDKINNFTLEKFSKLWMRNSCRNIEKIWELDGVCRYENKAGDLPFVILAAGPSLDEALPYLEGLKRRSVLVAVDTALRACLRAGVEPDFIVLSDPQFYAFQHIHGLKSESSILITELSAYPSVFRFECKEKILMSSIFPLGQYFEKSLGNKGALSSGGSVSTTAWDFARLSGAKRIYFAGLDLGFPSYQTHIKGSTFEERMHATSNRLSPAQKASVASLFGANMEFSEDYEHNPILTDNRMKMFSWWFENKALEHKDITSFSFSPRSLRIPGFRTETIRNFMKEKERVKEREEFLSSKNTHLPETKQKQSEIFRECYEKLLSGLDYLYSLAKKGTASCEEGMMNRLMQKQCLSKLEKIDGQILGSDFKDIASLVFPTENQLEKIFSCAEFSEDKTISTFQHSKIIYRELQEGIRSYRKNLPEKI